MAAHEPAGAGRGRTGGRRRRRARRTHRWRHRCQPCLAARQRRPRSRLRWRARAERARNGGRLAAGRILGQFSWRCAGGGAVRRRCVLRPSRRRRGGRVAAAFGWMARYRVAVINVSLVGPRNALLERVVASLVSRGHLIVAAVGNDGPAAPPLFPAAYDGVVGVTAVDQRHRVLFEACRGKHLDVAARGADLSAAASGHAGELRRRAWHVVRRADRGGPAGARIAGTRRRAARACGQRPAGRRAEDLGPRGRDDIYGAGWWAATSSRSQPSR